MAANNNIFSTQFGGVSLLFCVAWKEKDVRCIKLGSVKGRKSQANRLIDINLLQV